jgi:hypothetical protein
VAARWDCLPAHSPGPISRILANPRESFDLRRKAKKVVLSNSSADRKTAKRAPPEGLWPYAQLRRPAAWRPPRVVHPRALLHLVLNPPARFRARIRMGRPPGFCRVPFPPRGAYSQETCTRRKPVNFPALNKNTLDRNRSAQYASGILQTGLNCTHIFQSIFVQCTQLFLSIKPDLLSKARSRHACSLAWRGNK